MGGAIGYVPFPEFFSIGNNSKYCTILGLFSVQYANLQIWVAKEPHISILILQRETFLLSGVSACAFSPCNITLEEVTDHGVAT